MKIEHIVAAAGVLLLVLVIVSLAPRAPNSMYNLNEATSVFNSIPHVYTGAYVDNGNGLDRTLPLIVNYKTTDKEAYPTMVKIVAKMKEAKVDTVRIFFEDGVHMEWTATDFLTPNCFRHAHYNH